MLCTQKKKFVMNILLFYIFECDLKTNFNTAVNTLWRPRWKACTYVTALEKSKRPAILNIDLCLRQLHAALAFLYFFARLSLLVHCVCPVLDVATKTITRPLVENPLSSVRTTRKKQEPLLGKLFEHRRKFDRLSPRELRTSSREDTFSTSRRNESRSKIFRRQHVAPCQFARHGWWSRYFSINTSLAHCDNAFPNTFIDTTNISCTFAGLSPVPMRECYCSLPIMPVSWSTVTR